jgi:hypothetical protein
VQRERQVLRLVRWIPQGDHGVVAVRGTPVGNGLRHTFLDGLRQDLEDVGVLLVDAADIQGFGEADQDEGVGHRPRPLDIVVAPAGLDIAPERGVLERTTSEGHPLGNSRRRRQYEYFRSAIASIMRAATRRDTNPEGLTVRCRQTLTRSNLSSCCSARERHSLVGPPRPPHVAPRDVSAHVCDLSKRPSPTLSRNFIVITTLQAKIRR